MPVFALFHRSLTIDARSLSSYLMRGGLLLGLIIAVNMAQTSRLAAPGLSLFKALTWINLIFLLVAGVPVFATTITEEREGGTLGLLRTSQLSGLAILFGKSASTLVAILLILLAQLPFLLFGITLGGIAIHQIISVFVLLFCGTVLLASVGLLCSVCSRSGNRAISATLVPALAGMIALAVEFESIWNSPTPRPQLLHCVFILAAAACCFLLGHLRFALERPAEPDQNSQRPPIPIKSDEDPITWKEYHFQCGPRIERLFKGGVAVGLFVVGRLDLLPSTYWAFALGALLLVEFGYQVAAIFGEEYAQGTLATIYALPGGKGNVFERKLTARIRAVAPLYILGCLLLLVIHPKGYLMMMGVAVALMLIILPYGMLTVLLSVHIQRHSMVTAGLGIGLLLGIAALCIFPAYFIVGKLFILWVPVAYVIVNIFLFRALRVRLAEVTGRSKAQLAGRM
jgi:hypothetical protein